MSHLRGRPRLLYASVVYATHHRPNPEPVLAQPSRVAWAGTSPLHAMSRVAWAGTSPLHAMSRVA